jgi:cardiolipin synthase (CMP-forming)
MVENASPAPDRTRAAPAGVAAAARPREPLSNLPNLITAARLVSVPVTLWLILDERYGAAFWIFIAAGLSDALDGYLAKRFDWRTPLGALLDPAADKALIVGVYLTLGLGRQLPAWLVALVLLRDVLIVLGFFLVIQNSAAARKEVGPLFISKINTLVQIALIGFVLARLGLGIEAGLSTWLLIGLTGVTTVASGFTYLARWARVLVRSEPAL